MKTKNLANTTIPMNTDKKESAKTAGPLLAPIPILNLWSTFVFSTHHQDKPECAFAPHQAKEAKHKLEANGPKHRPNSCLKTNAFRWLPGMVGLLHCCVSDVTVDLTPETRYTMLQAVPSIKASQMKRGSLKVLRFTALC